MLTPFQPIMSYLAQNASARTCQGQAKPHCQGSTTALFGTRLKLQSRDYDAKFIAHTDTLDKSGTGQVSHGFCILKQSALALSHSSPLSLAIRLRLQVPNMQNLLNHRLWSNWRDDSRLVEMHL